MTWTETLFQNLLTIFILFSLFIILYLKMAKKTFPELIREIREVLSESPQIDGRIP